MSLLLHTPAKVYAYTNEKSIWWRKWRLILALTFALKGCALKDPQDHIVLREGEILAQLGDTVYSLARAHNVPVRDLIAANGLMPPYTLDPRQKLVLPSSGASLEKPKGRPVQPDEATGPRLVTQDSDVQWSQLGDEPAADAHIPPAIQRKPAEKIGLDLDQESHADAGQDIGEGDDEGDRIILPAGSQKNLKKERPDDLTLDAQRDRGRAARPKTGREAGDNSDSALNKPLTLASPVQGPVQRGFNPKKRCFGLYFRTRPGAPVKAAAPGRVLCAKPVDVPDKPMVLIQHTDGSMTAYFPLSAKQLKVKAGQMVGRGDILGQSDGGEFYFELRDKAQKPANPAPLMKK